VLYLIHSATPFFLFLCWPVLRYVWGAAAIVVQCIIGIGMRMLMMHHHYQLLGFNKHHPHGELLLDNSLAT
jgi:hypothetical protein